MTRALLALFLVLVHLPVPATPRRRAVQHPSPAVAPAAVVTAARQAADAAMNAGVPAVQIAVSERGRIIYEESFGTTDKATATAATPRSVMQIGSVTKQFTSAAILRLAERGALTLDDPIDKHVIDGFQSLLLYFSQEEIGVAVVTNAFPAPAAGAPQPIAIAVAAALAKP